MRRCGQITGSSVTDLGSWSCENEIWCSNVREQKLRLLDHLVGALLEKNRHLDTECLGGLEIDHQVELEGDLDRKLVRLRASQDAIGIDRCAPKVIRLVSSVGQETADFSEETVRIDGREAIA